MGKRRSGGSSGPGDKARRTGLKCETCGRVVADELALLKHRETSHLQRACAYCPSRFGTIEELMGHYKAAHPDGDPRKARPKLVLTSSHCPHCSQPHDSRTMYKFDWERREIVKCRCCDSCERDRRLVERNPGPPAPDPQAGINWNRAEAGVKYKCFLCEVAFDHPLVARSHFTRCHGFPKDIELVAHNTTEEEEAGSSGQLRTTELRPAAEEDGTEEVEVVAEEEDLAPDDLPVSVDADEDGLAKRFVVSDYRNSLFVSGNSRPRPVRPRQAQSLLEYQIRAPVGAGQEALLGPRDDSHRFELDDDQGLDCATIQLLPQEYAEEVTVVADF